MKTNNKSSFTLFFFLIAALVAVGSRFMPHPDNFSALGGLVFFCGFLLARNRFVLPILLAAVLLSDLLIGLYPGIEFVYLGYVATLGLGYFYRSQENRALDGATLVALQSVSALAFFVLSNFGVWYASGMYPLTWAGLVACFTLAIPFFPMTLISQVLVGSVFIKSYQWFFARSVSREKVRL